MQTDLMGWRITALFLLDFPNNDFFLFLIVRIPEISQTESTFSALYSPLFCCAVKNNKTIYAGVVRTDFTVMA